MPPETRWTGKDFTLDKIFNIDIISVDKKIEIKDYYSLETWESLVEYYKSGLKIYRPGKQFMKPYIFKKEIENEHQTP